MKIFFGIAASLFVLLFGIAQLYAGFIGIEYHFGIFWAFLALVFALMFRFTLPITIGAFFGAVDVWHWNIFLAMIFVSPGLIFIIPGMLMRIVSKITNWLTPRKHDPKQVIIEGEKADTD